MDELDIELALQYHTAKRRLKTVKKLRRFVIYKKDLDVIEFQIHQSLKYYENMINDKTLLKKKQKQKLTDDIFEKKHIETIFRYVFAYSTLSIRMMNSVWKNYMSFWIIK